MKRVLIMEDNALQALEWQQAFALNQFDATVTHNAEDAVVYLKKERFDIVITDLFVKGSHKGGLSVLNAARRLSESSPPVIAVTGASLGHNHKHEKNLFLEQAATLGADAIMEKPFNALELVLLVQSMLDPPARL